MSHVTALSFPETAINFTDITTGNAAAGQHGFLLKLLNSGAGKFLKEDGTWAVPGGSGGASYGLAFGTTSAQNPAASTTYYFGPGGGVTGTETSLTSFLSIPITGTVTNCGIGIKVGGTLSSAGVITFTLRKYNSSDYGTLATLATTAAVQSTSASGLSLAVTAGDQVHIKMATPAWSPTVPTTVTYFVNIYITVP